MSLAKSPGSTATDNGFSDSAQQYEARIESLLANNAMLREQLSATTQADAAESGVGKTIPPIVIDQDAAALIVLAIATGSFLSFILAG